MLHVDPGGVVGHAVGVGVEVLETKPDLEVRLRCVEILLEGVLDVEASSALTDAQKRRVLAKVGPTIRAIAQDERSQWRNRELAVDRVVEQLRQALKVERRRVATKPTKASRERRLESKKRRSATKKLRRSPAD